jgi:hypothetical protein
MQYMPFSLEIFICLESLELSAPMLPDQDLACAIKTAIEEELRRSMAFQRLPRLRSVVITVESGPRIQNLNAMAATH